MSDFFMVMHSILANKKKLLKKDHVKKLCKAWIMICKVKEVLFVLVSLISYSNNRSLLLFPFLSTFQVDSFLDFYHFVLRRDYRSDSSLISFLGNHLDILVA